MSSPSASHSRKPSLGDRWDRFWFGQGSLIDLACVRIALSAAALYGIYRYHGAVFQDARGASSAVVHRVWNPIYAFDVIGFGPLSLQGVQVLFAIAATSVVALLLGFKTRVAAALSAVSCFLWVGHHYSHGKPHHEFIALMFGLCALPFSPCGARLSVDAWWRTRNNKNNTQPSNTTDLATGALMPLRLTQISIALGYFFAGASKLAIGGITWLNGYTLQGITLSFDAPWSDWSAAHRLGCMFLSIGLIFVQVTFPLIFVHKLLRWFYAPSAIAFHLVSSQTMDTGLFITLWFTLAVFVDWRLLPGWWKRLGNRSYLKLSMAVGLLLLLFGALAWAYFDVVPGPYALLAVVPAQSLFTARGRQATSASA